MLEGIQNETTSPISGGLISCVSTGCGPRVDPRELLQKVDSLVTFPDSDFSAEYTFVENKPGEGVDSTQAAIFRRDAENKYLILILAPEVDRGKGYLKIGDNLWFYDPIPKKVRIHELPRPVS